MGFWSSLRMHTPPGNDPIAVFDRLAAAAPPAHAEALFDTACVLGGSIAGLFAARVLADYADKVVVIERDPVGAGGQPRAGVPQEKQVHTLLPAGLLWMERWLPGITREMEAGGAVLAGPGQLVNYLDGVPQVRVDHYPLLMASRPFLEASVRARVLGLPNVSLLQGLATGIEYQGAEVTGVRYGSAADPRTLPADLVVDAMGRASRLSDWLAEDGWDRPGMRRVPSRIHYTTATFRRVRKPEDLAVTSSIVRVTAPQPACGFAGAALQAIEGDRWVVLQAGYDDARPGRTVDEFRAACATMPPEFEEATRGELAGEIETYYHADSRRRDFPATGRFPARLVSMGDAVASFNPIYGQGMSSAALHAACLSEFLGSGPVLHEPATRFFELQDVVVDAAWGLSTGSDAARKDAISGADVPPAVIDQRLAMREIVRATLVDETVCRALLGVSFMTAHPGILADPELLELAVRANQLAA
jgi:2-polyprenyl-6-methoxyphenol hydroxylase-like FAD-dependent oxidoreductase